jgi:hypothetical protein
VQVSTKAAVINFAVTPAGLEEQLLGTTVAAERPDLDAARNELVVKVRVGGGWDRVRCRVAAGTGRTATSWRRSS